MAGIGAQINWGYSELDAIMRMQCTNQLCVVEGRNVSERDDRHSADDRDDEHGRDDR